jgi:ABC-type sugar transport system ATPase subunit
MELLRVSRVSKEQGRVLNDISFTLQHFQNLAIAGETGSGKSTLLKTIAGLVQPDGGEVHFEGGRVKGPEETLIPGHAGIAYLSQHFELRHHYTVAEVLSYANTLSELEAQTLYDLCQISHLLERKTDQLSGGEAQRIALCRLLISSPRLLLLDEPFSNGDAVHKALLKSVIHDIGEQLDITCIMVSHDPLDTLPWADEIMVLRQGKVVQHGPPTQIYHQPADEYTAGLFGPYNLVPSAQAGAFASLPGVVLNGKDLLLRPEQIKLEDKGAGTLDGKVTSIRFFGSYYEVEVGIGQNRIIVRTEGNSVQKGDTVHLSVMPDRICFI